MYLYLVLGLFSIFLWKFLSSSKKEENHESSSTIVKFKEISRENVKKEREKFYVVIDNFIFDFEKFSKKDLFLKSKGMDITEEFFEVKDYEKLFLEIEELKVGQVPSSEKKKRKRKIKDYTKEEVLKHVFHLIF
jgi:cytochrome b involved in lipid metabolism